MNYKQSLFYLNSFLNLERSVLHPNPRFWNLERMRWLLRQFDCDKAPFTRVLIVGTKGKGSTGFFLSSILNAAGILTGFYSSPHLETVRERIRIRGRRVSEKLWAQGMTGIRNKLMRHPVPEKLGQPSYFELVTLLAVLLFKKQKVRVAILEAGLGGRLDATNALDPDLVLITPIHLDHEALLGNTIAKIAREKAAVTRPSSDVIVASQSKEAARVIENEIAQKKAVRWPLDQRKHATKLEGDFQKENATVAQTAVKVLREKYGYPISDRAIQEGLNATDWPGRMERMGRVLIDGAHNPASIEALVKNLQPEDSKGILIFSAARDKRAGQMLASLARVFKTVVLCPVPNPRSFEVATLVSYAKPHFPQIFPAENIENALQLAAQLAGPTGRIVATGSFYLIGEIRRVLSFEITCKHRPRNLI